MPTKSDLVEEMLRELRKARATEWKHPSAGPIDMIELPPILWRGEGQHLVVTEALLNAVSAYSQICLNNDSQIKLRFKFDEFESFVEQSFGSALAEADLSLSDAELEPIVSERVRNLLAEQINGHNRPFELTIGCHLLEGDEPYPLQIGPVIFDRREAWRRRMLATGKLSSTTAHRLHRRWSGESLRKRKNSLDSSIENSISNSIGECPVVCTVATDYLSSKYAQEKGLMAARLAMTAVSLVWRQPSQGLQWMKLLYDRQQPRGYTTMFGPGTSVILRSTLNEFPTGRYSEPQLLQGLHSYRWLFDQVGNALNGYVQPNRHVARPRMMNALFLSIWWYHEACREPSDQIATTKFAASMDALSGGKGAWEIIELMGARLGREPDDRLMKDGRTTKAVITQIYNASRSKLIHGSSTDYAHDWSQPRRNAEEIGRHLLIACCDWLSRNPENDDLNELRKKHTGTAKN